MTGHTRTIVILAALAILFGGADLSAQTSSLGARGRQVRARMVKPVVSREAPLVARNAIYDQYSWITIKPAPPKTFKVGDLLTIIVRERRLFEADGDLETKKKLNIKSDLTAFLRPIDRGLGAATFRRGNPNIDYKLDSKFKNEGDTSREDRMTMRVSGTIIDVKPNGLLVLEAKARVQHDDEISEITFTGTCRKEDVTPDNTILSTQVADKNIVVINEGAIRSASTRGWFPKLFDSIRPF